MEVGLSTLLVRRLYEFEHSAVLALMYIQTPRPITYRPMYTPLNYCLIATQ